MAKKDPTEGLKTAAQNLREALDQAKQEPAPEPVPPPVAEEVVRFPDRPAPGYVIPLEFRWLALHLALTGASQSGIRIQLPLYEWVLGLEEELSWIDFLTGCCQHELLWRCFRLIRPLANDQAESFREEARSRSRLVAEAAFQSDQLRPAWLRGGLDAATKELEQLVRQPAQPAPPQPQPRPVPNPAPTPAPVQGPTNRADADAILEILERAQPGTHGNLELEDVARVIARLSEKERGEPGKLRAAGILEDDCQDLADLLISGGYARR